MDKNKKNDDIQLEEEVNRCLRCDTEIKDEESDYCEKCEIAMLSHKIPLAGWLLGAIVVVLGIFSSVILYYVASPAILGISGEIAARDNRWEDAYYDYSEMISQIEGIELEQQGKLFAPSFIDAGRNLEMRHIESIVNATDPITGMYGVQRIYPDPTPYLENESIKSYYDMYISIGTTEYAIYYMIQEAQTYDECVAVIREVAAEEGVDKVFLCFYVYEIARDFGEPIDTRLEILKKCDDLAKASGKDYTWLYALEYSKTLQHAGKYNDSIAWADKLISANKTHFEAISQKVEVLYLSGKKAEAKKLIEDTEALYNNTYVHTMNVAYLRWEGKLDEAIELGDTLLGTYESSPELYRQLALVYLLKGDYGTAYTFAYDAFTAAVNYAEYYYDDSWNNNETRNTLYVCASLCNVNGDTNTEYGSEIPAILDSFELVDLGEKVESVASGETDPTELLTKGNYDLI